MARKKKRQPVEVPASLPAASANQLRYDQEERMDVLDGNVGAVAVRDRHTPLPNRIRERPGGPI